jgi:hypothetical protein
VAVFVIASSPLSSNVVLALDQIPDALEPAGTFAQVPPMPPVRFERLSPTPSGNGEVASTRGRANPPPIRASVDERLDPVGAPSGGNVTVVAANVGAATAAHANITAAPAASLAVNRGSRNPVRPSEPPESSCYRVLIVASDCLLDVPWQRVALGSGTRRPGLPVASSGPAVTRFQRTP